MSYVTLTSTPLNWQDFSRDPNAQWNGGGFATQVALFKNGSRILLNEAWGWSVYDNSNPMAPRRLNSRDVRFPIRDHTLAATPGWHSLSTGGDGQSATSGFCISPDGARLGAYMNGSSVRAWREIFADTEGEGFRLEESRYLNALYGQAMQQINNRYIVYATGGALCAADITNLSSSGIVFSDGSGTESNTNIPEGMFPAISGNFLAYTGPSGIVIVNISNPGPIGSILNNIPNTTITSTVLGLTAGQNIHTFTMSVDPIDSSKLWVLVSIVGPSNNVTYFLVSVTSNLTLTVVGTPWSIPNPTLYSQNGAYSNALVINNNILYILIWDIQQPTGAYGNSSDNSLYSTSVDQWVNINTSVPPNKFTMPADLSGFALGQFPNCLSIGNNIYIYAACGEAAYVIPLTCVVTGGGGGGGGTVPDAPTGLEVSKINDTTVRLAWTPPGAAVTPAPSGWTSPSSVVPKSFELYPADSTQPFWDNASVMDFFAYQNGTKLLTPLRFGYHVFDIVDRISPRPLGLDDMRLDSPGIIAGGDSHGTLSALAVSADGKRAIFGLSQQAGGPLLTRVGQLNEAYGWSFVLNGDMAPRTPSGTLVQKAGSSYFAYTFSDVVRVADATTLPGLDENAPDGMHSVVATSLPGGFSPILSGYWLTYWDGSSIYLVNASSPLPATGLTAHTLTATSFGRAPVQSIRNYSAAQDPTDPAVMYILAEFSTGSTYPFTSAGYTLIRVLDWVTTIIGSFTIDTGETGISSTLVTDNVGNVFSITWVQTSSGTIRLYGSSVLAFGTASTPINITTPEFRGARLCVAGVAPGQIYAYSANGAQAWVTPIFFTKTP